MTCKIESGSIKTGMLACVAAIAMSSSMVAMADEHEDAKPEGEVVAAGMDLALANQLADYGDRNNDALSLIVAANIMNGLGTVEDREGEPESEGSGEVGEDKPEQAGILDRARDLAGDNEELIALIEDAEMASDRAGDIAGPGCYHDRVYSGYTDIWTITFTPGSNYVSLDGDGDTDLDLRVYAGGRLICQSLSYSDNEFCSWNQYNTGTVRVEVDNLGYVYNVYDLCTN